MKREDTRTRQAMLARLACKSGSWRPAALGPFWPSTRPFDLAALGLSLLVLALYTKLAAYSPPLGYDESASYLGVQILEGKFGLPIDPAGASFTRYYRSDCYPPVYYLVSAL